jgi:hypothetical protein
MKGGKKYWEWTPDMETAFVNRKEYFTTAPILTYYSPEHQYIVETDTCVFGLQPVTSQKSSDDKLYPIGYYSAKFSAAKINYKIHDKELFAVVDYFEIWQKYLEGTLLLVLVYTDYQNLEYFTTTRVLNRRQAHWAQHLAGIDFKICYHPGSQKGKPDTFSRRSQYRPPNWGCEEQLIQTVLQE